jgi:hypothetical protein
MKYVREGQGEEGGQERVTGRRENAGRGRFAGGGSGIGNSSYPASVRNIWFWFDEV